MTEPDVRAAQIVEGTRVTATRATAAWLKTGALTFAGAGACWQLSLVLRLWAGRFRYPWDIEWLEGPALYEAYRITKGLPTFGSPRGGYLPLNHPPLYPATLAVLGRVFGLDYPVARTFSLLCFLGAAALAAAALLRRFGKGPRGWALCALAAGCSAAAAPVCMAVFDLVRDDVMSVFACTTCAALVPRERRLGAGRCVALALAVTAVVYTRLPAVFPAAWVVLFVFLRDPRSGLRIAVLAAACCGLVLVGLLFSSHGWYWILTVGLVQDQHVRPERLDWGIRIVLGFAPFLPALPLVAIGLAVARRLSAASVLWLGMLLASLPASLLPWAKVGGFENDFLPLLFFIGPATAFLIGDLVLAQEPRFPRLSLAVEGTLVVAGAGFLALRTWSLERWTPTDAMRAGAASLNARVASLQGGVVIPRHPFVPIRDGHDTLNWSEMPYLDMLWSGYTDLSLGQYVDASRAKYALVSGTELVVTARELAARYQLDAFVSDGPDMLIGDASKIRYVLRSNDDESGGHVVFDFESLSGWSGAPGVFVITDPRPSWQQPIEAAVGAHLVDSYSRSGGDRVTGTIESPPFVIDRPRISLRVGGGTRMSTRAELQVEGRTELQAVSIWREQETLTRVVWDVRRFLGKTAQIILVDEDAGSWGHLTCDHVVLY